MDFIVELQRLCGAEGYERVADDEKIIWIKEEDDEVKVIHLVPETLPGQRPQTIKEQEKEITERENRIMLHFGKKTERLTLMLFQGMPGENRVKEIIPYPNIWCLDKQKGRLLIYERQRMDFYGWRTRLEAFLENYKREEEINNRKELGNILQPVTWGIILSNIFVFFLLHMWGNVSDASFMAEHGAMTWSGIVERGEYYRLFTSTFLHFGMDHLVQNMLILLLTGARLERIMGRGRYVFLYCGSGVFASVCSLVFTLRGEPFTVSAGASGAVFGVMGGLFYFILRDFLKRERGKIQEIGLNGIVFMIIAALSYGFTTGGVDNAAHLGGVFAGFFLAGLSMLGQGHGKKYRRDLEQQVKN